MASTSKTSKLKPNLARQRIEQRIRDELGGRGGVSQLTEGHNSQAYTYRDATSTKVLRIATKSDGFRRDQYAYQHFGGPQLPIPEVYRIGSIHDYVYCVSQYVEGTCFHDLSTIQQTTSRESRIIAYGSLFSTPIHQPGWGKLDPASGRGKYDTWDQEFREYLEDLSLAKLKEEVGKHGLSIAYLQQQVHQLESLVDEIPEPPRGLIHGDLGNDNVLIHQDHVVAILDWDLCGYGDCMSDIAWMDFWRPGQFGDLTAFIARFKLDDAMIKQRHAFYTAYTYLTTLEWALEHNNTDTLNFLKQHHNGEL